MDSPLVLLEEPLRVVVGINVDLSQRVVSSRLVAALVNSSLQPRQQEFQPAI